MIKGDTGTFAGESEGLTPLERLWFAPLGGGCRRDLSMLEHFVGGGPSHLPCLNSMFVFMWPGIKLDTLAVQGMLWIHFHVASCLNSVWDSYFPFVNSIVRFGPPPQPGKIF